MTELGWRWEALGVISAMEKVRVNNNVAWMDVLRLAVAHAPSEEIKRLFSKIQENDREIELLWTMLKSKIPD